MSKINVMVFPANSIELHDALATNVNINLFGASSKPVGTEFFYKKYFLDVPLITDDHFITCFNRILDENRIDFIFPSHDTVAVFLKEHENEIHAKIIMSDLNTAKICRNKDKAYELFKDTDFVPTIYANKNNIKKYPVFVKPIDGQGGKDSYFINDKTEFLDKFNDKNYLICEYLPGDEFTVDCFTDRNKNLRVVSPRSRNRTLGGICIDGKIEKLTDEIKNIACIINERLNFRGLWYFQIKKDDKGKFKLLEISTRCAGTMGLTRAIGINLPLLSVYDFLDKDIKIERNNYELSMVRQLKMTCKIDYEWNVVYIDYDDTIIIDNEVNLVAIQFLYQCKNKNKQIILLTKHKDKILKSMNEHAISEKLFSSIIQINENDLKSKYIKIKNAIFIDNSFNERTDVFNKCGIPVFDVDNIENLINN